MSTQLQTFSLKNIVCSSPYWHFEVHLGGKVYHCCPSWLPIVVGNIKQHSFFDIMNGELSTKIRKSMETGEFSYCKKDTCPYLSKYLAAGDDNDIGPLEKKSDDKIFNSFFHSKRASIILSYDRSCNLRCESCRNDLEIFAVDNLPRDLTRTHEAVVNNLTQLLEQDYTVYLNITGSGDPFASPLYNKLMQEMKHYPKLFLQLQTNGILMEEKRFTPAMKKMLHFLSVSIDAATDETYSLVRRGGSFEKLKQNLHWINSAILQKQFENLEHYKINFIVQKDNYKEMVLFAKWILSAYPSVKEIWFNLISDWGHLSKESFAQKAVWQPTHPEHESFLEIANDPFLHSDTKINLGNLSSYIK